MRKYISLTKRDFLVFVRDRAAVFFSLLTMLIILMLCGVFLKGSNVDGITGLLEKYGGPRDASLDLENANHLIEYWILAGILAVNTITVSLTVIGVMVNDAAENRLESFFCAPVDRKTIALAYITAASLISILFDILTLVIGVAYIVGTGGEALKLQNVLYILGYIILNAVVCSIVMYLIALFIKSSSAWSGIATVVGTLVGFIGAIYLPMGMLPEKVADVLKYLPLLHSTSLMRNACCSEIVKTTFMDTPSQLIEEYQETMGITVVMGDEVVASLPQILFIAGCGLVAFLVIVIVSSKKRVSDR